MDHRRHTDIESVNWTCNEITARIIYQYWRLESSTYHCNSSGVWSVDGKLDEEESLVVDRNPPDIQTQFWNVPASLWTWPGSVCWIRSETSWRVLKQTGFRFTGFILVKISELHSTIILDLGLQSIMGILTGLSITEPPPPLSGWTIHSHHPPPPLFSYTHTQTPDALAAMWPHFNLWYLQVFLSVWITAERLWLISVCRSLFQTSERCCCCWDPFYQEILNRNYNIYVRLQHAIGFITDYLSNESFGL